MVTQKSYSKQIFILLLSLIILFLTFGVLTGHASSRVNSYIYHHHFKHARITYHIYRRFPHLKYRHGKGHPEGVVVHETGNPRSNIYGEINFMKHDYKNAFVHSFVDNHHIINIANTKYISWGVGYPGNARFVQFEQIEMHSKRAFAKEVNNAAYYTAHLLKRYHLRPKDAAYTGKGTVWSHASVAKHLGGSDHTDPISYYHQSGRRWFGEPYSMHQFYHLVLHYYKKGHKGHKKAYRIKIQSRKKINNIKRIKKHAHRKNILRKHSQNNNIVKKLENNN